MRKLFLLAALVVPLALIGCSDSSDGGVSTNYTGTTAKAALSTEGNASDLGAATVTGMTLAYDPFDYEFFPEFLYELQYFAFDRAKKLNTISDSSSISISGGCGGTVVGSLSMKSFWDDETKEDGDYITLNLTFNDYSDWGDCYYNNDMLPSTDGAILNGSYSFYFKYNEDQTSFTGSRKYVFGNLTFFYPDDWGYVDRVAAAPGPVDMLHSDTGYVESYSGKVYDNANASMETSYYEKDTIDLSFSQKLIIPGELPDTLETQDLYSVLWAGLSLTEDPANYKGLKISGKVCVDGVGCVTVANNEFDGNIYDLDYYYDYQPWGGSVILSGEGMDRVEVELSYGDISCPYELYYSEDGGDNWDFIDIYYGYPVDLEWDYCE